MAKDPAFLFYPGDYLRDTQTLSEKTQVSYDRIMCEHMRNICISKQQLKFFTKRLNDDELDELMFILKEIKGGFQIEWVAESIEKRRAYSESRRNNRKKKPKEDMKTYDEHMENENVNEDINKFNFKSSLIGLGVEKEIVTDWLKVRKLKKASNTETAFNRIEAQINKSHLPANDCIRIAVEKSWSGFEADWVKDEKPIEEELKSQYLCRYQNHKSRYYCNSEEEAKEIFKKNNGVYPETIKKIK